MERLPGRKIPEHEFSIRFHHLGYFLEFKAAFSNKFGVTGPWELPEKDLRRTKTLVDRFIFRDLESWAKMRYLLEEESSGDETRDKELKYIYDVIGSSVEQLAEVVKGRRRVLNGFLDIARDDKNARIPLIIEPDGYCKTCVVGEHCIRREAKKEGVVDRDFVFKESIEHLLQNGSWDGKLTREDERIFITPELLFDIEFFRSLWKDIERSGNGEWL